VVDVTKGSNEAEKPKTSQLGVTVLRAYITEHRPDLKCGTEDVVEYGESGDSGAEELREEGEEDEEDNDNEGEEGEEEGDET